MADRDDQPPADDLEGDLRRRSPRRWSATRRVFVMGEDIGVYGGIFGATEGLLGEVRPRADHGHPDLRDRLHRRRHRVPRVSGMRPIAELMFVDFFGVCMDQIYNHMAKIHYESGGNLNGADGDHDRDGRRLLRRRAALADALRDVRPPARHEDRGPLDAVRRQGADDLRHPRRQPRPLLLPQGRHGARLDDAKPARHRARCPRSRTRCRSARPT